MNAGEAAPVCPQACRRWFACRTRAKVWFAGLTTIQLLLYALLTLVSSGFQFDSDGASRPLLAVYAILATAFVAYLVSIPLALTLGDSPRWIAVFLGVAIAARAIVLVSEPIQEVDIYRYIWDGAVSGEGISPYRFRPQQVRQTMEPDGDASKDKDLRHLASLAAQRPGLLEVLRRVHFSELPTVYPPVSQLVFWVANRLTPDDASATTHLRVMKGVMVLFDLGVMLLLLMLLKLLGINGAWCIAYGWSPLVIKEFANSGHLDSIAVFFCLAAIVCIAMARQSDRTKLGLFCSLGSGVLLGLSVGAKLYPIVLLPLMTCLIWRLGGFWRSITWLAVACLITALTLAP